jgi:hypothetical protein
VFAAYPFAFFQAAAYAESMMILFSALAIFLALERRLFWATLVLGAGALARHLTLFAGAGLAVAQFRRRGFSLRRFFLDVRMPALLLPLVPSVYFVHWLGNKFGDPLVFWHAREMQWGNARYSLFKVFTELPFEHPYVSVHLYVYFAVVPLVGTILLFKRREWLELAAASSLLTLVLVWGGAFGLGRFCAALWPSFLPLGAWCAKRDTSAAAFVATLALFQGVFFFLFSHQWSIL